MHALVWIGGLWPGFLRAWVLGRTSGLALATAFGVALNTALVVTSVWSHGQAAGNVPGAGAALAWLVVLGFWIVGLAQLRSDLPLMAAKRSKTGDDVEHEAEFRKAQHEYLMGHWIEAETRIGKLLARRPQDVEARLLLAAIQRRTRRADEARATLLDLRQDAAAAHWNMEIENELKFLAAWESEGNGRWEARAA